MYQVKRPDGSVVEMDEATIRERLRDGGVLPWDMVSADGELYMQARGYNELRDETAEAAVALTDFCWRHEDRVATMRCRQCGRGYCADCAPRKATGPTDRLACPACSGAVEPYVARAHEKPFWKDPVTTLLYPLREMSWVTTAGVAFLLWGGRMIPPFTLVLYFLGMAYVVHAIASSAEGKTRMGHGPDADDAFAMIGRGFVAAMVAANIVLPILAFDLFVAGGVLWDAITGDPAILARADVRKVLRQLVVVNALYGIAAFVYYPMALGIAAIWQNKWIAFRPTRVVEHIRLIPRDYAIVVAAAALLWMARTALGGLLRVVLMGIFSMGGLTGLATALVLNGIAQELLSAYVLLLNAHILGRTLYINESRLGWD